MQLKALARGAVRKLRPAVRRVPLVGHGLRYTKRLVMLPWNFHKLLAAWSAAPPAEAAAAAHRAAWDASGATQATVWKATQGVAHVTVGQTWLAAEHVVRQLQTVAGDIAAELRTLNETHAACYDRLNETARDQAADIRRLTDTLAELTARVDEIAARSGPHAEVRNGNGHGSHAPAVLRRVG